MTPQKPQPQCRLLELPGELRNKIYRLALLSADNHNTRYITFTRTGYDRLALLNTCKLIRKEARTIYYYENIFVTTPTQHDSTTLNTFRQHVQPMGLARKKVDVRMYMPPDHEPNWANLMEWVKRYHARAVHIPAFGGVREVRTQRYWKAHHYVVTGLFETARGLRDLPWSVVEKAVVNQRPALGFLDARWKED